jgi:5-(carboxyamino)imidazole ribonucleotide synthase
MKKRQRIGILGGGQLARMSAYQAYKLGFEVAILEKEFQSPAGQLTKHEFVGWVDDKELVEEFALDCDVITLENEFIDYQDLQFIEEKLRKKVLPTSKTISLIQDKYIQKKTMRRNGIPVPDFIAVQSSLTYKQISQKLGEKFILKSRKMGYDGYGNALVTDEESYAAGIKRLSERHSELMAEEFIDFKKELAVMIVRTKYEIKSYPVVETIQKEHICHTVIAPARIEKKYLKEAEDIAVKSVEAVKGIGIFGIELFITKNNKLLVNEMAPRPHNSGHYTIEGCITSQFENHIRAVLNLPLGSTEMVKPYAVMINLLGKKEGAGIVENYNEALKNDVVHLHIYGKAKSRLGRKMGHITITGNNLKSILTQAKEVEKSTYI